jgi:hypothetical protein
MFCPKCGIQNKDEQKFCRGCGQSLTSLQVALNLKLEETATKLTKDMDKLASGAVTMAIFLMIAFLVHTFGGDRITVTLNLFLGLLIGGSLTYAGIKRLKRSIKSLDPKEQAKPLAKADPAGFELPDLASVAMPAVPDTDPLVVEPASLAITEHTTHHLNRP